ncbi:MAG: hypothetical protein EOP50_10050, partial [Sphingobacteriales bacterium]
MLAVPEPFKTMVWFAPPVLYVTVAFGVPVKVTVADPFGQTLALLLMVTVGGGITVIVIEPETGAVQLVGPAEVMLTSV